MLEKIGLPPKPSLRGNNWVVDASHCQGCASQFTFINRKHHCRRCGGIFCGTCTKQRMILRGQGDSAVRICDPCKNLEDAARFELRHGHRSRATKGSLKEISKNEEEAVNEILGMGGKKPKLAAYGIHRGTVSVLLGTEIGALGSTSCEAVASSADVVANSLLNEISFSSPEELRRQAIEEKKTYKILKEEGKQKEALQAFKKGKELERQAAALEIELRKNRRKASEVSGSGSIAYSKDPDTLEGSSNKKKKDDFENELREMGLSYADLHDAEKKQAKVSLEAELINLLKENPQKSSRIRSVSGLDRTQVNAYKKQALAFKREGKLAEAKEELKKAKLLEKQIEEQELLGDSEESDDDLSALIKSMEAQDELPLDLGYGDTGFNLNGLLAFPDDIAHVDNVEVTDRDLNDPDLVNDLKLFGWTEEDDEHEDNHKMEPIIRDHKTSMDEVHALKREALHQKRVGNMSEAMELLKKAKLLERNLEDIHDSQTSVTECAEEYTPQISGESVIATENSEISRSNVPRKSKLMIQRELLNIKKKALSLRREGLAEEAEEELKKGKVLEQQLEEMDNAQRMPAVPQVVKEMPKPKTTPEFRDHDIGSDPEGDEVIQLTDQDMNDPVLLSTLKGLGFEEEDSEDQDLVVKHFKQSTDKTLSVDNPAVSEKLLRSKAEIQRELLSLKRKALVLRRQGRTEEANEDMRRAKDLEDEIAAVEASDANFKEPIPSFSGPLAAQAEIDNHITLNVHKTGIVQASVEDKLMEQGPSTGPVGKAGSCYAVSASYKLVPKVNETDLQLTSRQDTSAQDVAYGGNNSYSRLGTEGESTSSQNHNFFSRGPIPSVCETVTDITSVSTTPVGRLSGEVGISKDAIQARKRKAMALKREGKLAEAKEELRQAKAMEKILEDSQNGSKEVRPEPSSTSDGASSMQDSKVDANEKTISSRDRLKLQQQSLAHKRNALKLRREGKVQESDAELELAKALESQLEAVSKHVPSTDNPRTGESSNDVGVEDLLDAQLVSALKSIGWGDGDFAAQHSKKSEPKPDVAKNGKPASKKEQLEEQIKGEKLRALNLKRAGKQSEALEALRAAKRLEKQLELLL